MEGFPCTLTDQLFGVSGIFLDALQVTVRVWKMFPDSIELREDAHLHLFRCLVGKGNCQNVAIACRILYKQLNILGGQCECLSASSTSLKDCEGFYHLLNSSMVNLHPTLSIFAPKKLAKNPVER